MKLRIFIISILLYLGPGSALAEELVADKRAYNNQSTPQCPIIENSQVNINFNSQESDLAQIKVIMDDKLKLMETLAKEAGVKKFEMQSMNYNVYAENSGQYGCSSSANSRGIYRLNGNISFNAHPSEKATDLLILLNENGYSGNLNVNKHRRCH